MNIAESKKFRAVTMSDALRMVKEEFGSSAIIVSSKSVADQSGKFGMFARKMVEVIAAPPAQKLKTSRIAERRNRAVSSYEDRSSSVAPLLLDEINSLQDGMKKLLHKDKYDTAVQSTNSAQRISDDVRELKSMISYLLDQAGIEKEKGLPRSFLALSRILTDRGIAKEYVETLIDEFFDKQSKHAPDTATLLKASAKRMQDVLKFDGYIVPGKRDTKNPKVVALTGPTGVGKTTTIAKLAATLKADGMNVALATIDTYRIAAIEQLKTYAQLIDIPLEVLLTPNDLGKVIHMNRSCDIILVDTAGRSQRDLEEIESLGKFLNGDYDVITYLVLSSAGSPEQNTESIKNFSSLGISSLIFTKLDEAVNYGSIFNAMAQSGLPASYFTNGQRVPEDIEPAGAKRLFKSIFKKVGSGEVSTPLSQN